VSQRVAARFVEAIHTWETAGSSMLQEAAKYLVVALNTRETRFKDFHLKYEDDLFIQSGGVGA